MQIPPARVRCSVVAEAQTWDGPLWANKVTLFFNLYDLNGDGLHNEIDVTKLAAGYKNVNYVKPLQVDVTLDLVSCSSGARFFNSRFNFFYFIPHSPVTARTLWQDCLNLSVTSLMTTLDAEMDVKHDIFYFLFYLRVATLL